ncbi:FirrV-1-C8 [Feldmannia irregularis virus a]|uniref:FirrV-1-C8 n=1 Tax=Feldmannia irregularis virus a TaxID=231992 RepID=Q6XLX0_9PHYC|nr:FirrV-1-C8 [Feldmannia irregularis virus a]AAR26941.1 FirrV-1-C8 [Feldmannia irregularis virus a]
MGASCSSTALNRYNNIKKRLNQKTCLTFGSADGLLPRMEGQAPPIWLFGEDHAENESDYIKGNMRNCALVTDLVEQAVSSCDKNSVEVIVVFENAVVADNPYFFKRDVNDAEHEGDAHHDVRSIRRTVKEQAVLYKNISITYMDVFGRVRLFYQDQLDDPRLGHNKYVINMVQQELKEFWVTCGKYEDKKARSKSMCLLQRSMPVAHDMMRRFQQNKCVNPRNGFKIFITLLCVNIARVLLLSRIHNNLDLTLRRADMKVIKDIDNHIEYILGGNINIPAALQRGIVYGHVRKEEAKFMIFEAEVFGLIVLAGDAILYEFLSSLNGSDKLVVMHAGFQHVNHQRKWLLKGKYDSDFEKVSDLLLQHEDFAESRT